MSEILCVDGSHWFVKYFNVVAKLLFGPKGRAVTKTQSKNPRIVVFSFAGREHKKYPNAKLVFVSGEAHDCSKKIYQLLIDSKTALALRAKTGRFLYVPLAAMSFWERYEHTPTALVTPVRNIPPKPRFCAFLAFHNVAFRNALVRKIAKYKAVDALGVCMNPEINDVKKTDRKLYNAKITYYDTSVVKYRPYRFVICCENKRVKGYCTEKIINARLAHAVPIYLGDPDVSKLFNPRAFVDASKPGFMRQIMELDKNKAKFEAMVRAPWFRNNTLPNWMKAEHAAAAIRKIL